MQEFSLRGAWRRISGSDGSGFVRCFGSSLVSIGSVSFDSHWHGFQQWVWQNWA